MPRSAASNNFLRETTIEYRIGRAHHAVEPIARSPSAAKLHAGLSPARPPVAHRLGVSQYRLPASTSLLDPIGTAAPQPALPPVGAKQDKCRIARSQGWIC